MKKESSLIGSFDKNVIITKAFNTRSIGSISYTYRCRKGLFCVTGQDEESVKREAIHYFRQYHSDGEYNET